MLSRSTRVLTLAMQHRCGALSNALTVVLTTWIITLLRCPPMSASTTTTIPPSGISGISTFAIASWLAPRSEGASMTCGSLALGLPSSATAKQGTTEALTRQPTRTGPTAISSAAALANGTGMLKLSPAYTTSQLIWARSLLVSAFSPTPVLVMTAWRHVWARFANTCANACCSVPAGAMAVPPYVCTPMGCHPMKVTPQSLKESSTSKEPVGAPPSLKTSTSMLAVTPTMPGMLSGMMWALP
mmetsp:Transcript_58310/g.137241  ORF Transcript_58310/g.137241 Transcript_58310/m.137241 type:complete len:243 (+) Transcript_58310:110-838(+)